MQTHQAPLANLLAPTLRIRYSKEWPQDHRSGGVSTTAIQITKLHQQSQKYFQMLLLLLPRMQTRRTGEAGVRSSLNLWGITEQSQCARSNVLQAFFNIMLRELGVKGVKVCEVVSLDEDILSLLP